MDSNRSLLLKEFLQGVALITATSAAMAVALAMLHAFGLRYE